LESVQVRNFDHNNMKFTNIMLLILAIDECSTVADCVGGTICINIADGPGFLCECPPGFTGDGRRSGDSCIGKNHCDSATCMDKIRVGTKAVG
jgi:hypothetical protein